MEGGSHSSFEDEGWAESCRGEKMGKGDLRVNAERLRATIKELARIGGTAGGGMHRLALTDEDKQARDLFVQWLKELGLEIIVDEMGNIFGKRKGRSPQLPMVLSGSHLDTQPKGGRFDGILGVTGALEAMRTIHENHIDTERSIAIVDWTDEEGTRFAPAMLGSGVWAGYFDRDWAYSRADLAGKSFGEELERIGYRGKTQARKWPVHAYYEYHIEQGPVLEKMGKRIGVPKGILGITWFDVYVEGQANQAGPTPMNARQDALVAAAEMILKVNDLPAKMGADLVTTVGEIQNFPNSRNIIPDRVRFTVDIRSWDDPFKNRAAEAIKKEFTEIGQKRGCSVRVDVIWEIPHTEFSSNLVGRVEKIASLLGYSNYPMVSGAGHDAAYVCRVAPTAMIFVPSIGGRSHVEVERTHWEDCEAGANVLLHCLLQSANE
jgi:beta-ureidopropionase / N-carbamoyl-L-amino-acid hydrolase